MEVKGDNSFGCLMLGFFLCVLVSILLRAIDGTAFEATLAAWMRAAGF